MGSACGGLGVSDGGFVLCSQVVESDSRPKPRRQNLEGARAPGSASLKCCIELPHRPGLASACLSSFASEARGYFRRHSVAS